MIHFQHAMKGKLSFWKDNLAALGMIAGVLLTIIGGTMAVLGGYVGFTIHDSIRWDSLIGEQLGNMTGNTTQYTVVWEPIDNDASVAQALKVYNRSNCASGSCATGTRTTITTTPCGAAPCYTVDDAALGTVTVNMSYVATGMTDAQRNAQVVTADYSGVKSGTDISNVYTKIIKALVILGVAFIVTGVSVMFRELSDL